MTYQIFPDGSVACDTLDEVLSYQQATGSGVGSSSGLQRLQVWTRPLVDSFLEQVPPNTRDLVVALLGIDGGISSADFAELNQWSRHSLGNRFAKLKRDTRAFASSLPVPGRLDGKPGSKTIQVDPNFRAAATEAIL